MLYKVFYTDWFVLPNIAATTYGPFIFIRPSKRGNVGILEHEKVHVKQFWRNPFFGIAYLLSKRARLKYEVEAYKKQLKYASGREEVFAQILATEYRLNISKEEALKLLKE